MNEGYLCAKPIFSEGIMRNIIIIITIATNVLAAMKSYECKEGSKGVNPND